MSIEDKQRFDEFFAQVTGFDEPHGWQATLGNERVCSNRLVRIPTGMGKTQGVLAAWLYQRVVRNDNDWPRRLVWCLPMRTLVEQTLAVAEAMIQQLPDQSVPEVAAVMGGEDLGEWHLHPDKPSILIGTQDMLLSRALNRGYGSGRARWPMEFGQLHHDALWIMDEIQLMDVGLATSAQIQAFRDQDSDKGLRPCFTWWMSATLQSDWLKSVDTVEQYPQWTERIVTIPVEQRSGGLWTASKSLSADAIAQQDAKAFARRVLTEHASERNGDQDNEHGRVTLAVCNTVDRACATHEALTKLVDHDETELLLIHSRFRPTEREDWRERFLSRNACTPGANRIIVATQVVEAGVDISAGCVITDLAPWPSLVQRFGRCARYGGCGKVVVIDRGRDEKMALPYASEELESAWDALQSIGDVGIAGLEDYETSLGSDTLAKLYPYSPAHLLLRQEFYELFDTTPDLTGADLDISRFIRSGDERDLQVFWLDMEKDQTPPSNRQPQRRELCAVPFLKARDWLCGAETKTNRKPKLLGRIRAWVWDWIDGQWEVATRAHLSPGRIVCVDVVCGGYSSDRGFDPESREKVDSVPMVSVDDDIDKLIRADAHQDGEDQSVSQWKTIACHNQEVAKTVGNISQSLDLPDKLREVLELAGQWHDLGKAHPAFQGAIRGDERPDRVDLAKAPPNAWLRPYGTYRFADDSDTRPAFRHELASALALFAVLARYAPLHDALLGPWSEAFAAMGVPLVQAEDDTAIPTAIEQAVLNCSAEDFDLLAYLVASHHGKVRIGLHAAPSDQDYDDRDGRGLPIRGVRDEDRLPAVAIDPDSNPLPELTLTLAPAMLGLSKRTGASWCERCQGLLERYGPVSLAYIETLLRVADIRASRMMTPDLTLHEETSV